MITTLGEFVNGKIELLSNYQNNINKLKNELNDLAKGDNKDNLLMIRRELYFYLENQLPKRFGRGNERMQENINNKKIKFNKILEEFDTEYELTETDLKMDTIQRSRFTIYSVIKDKLSK